MAEMPLTMLQTEQKQGKGYIEIAQPKPKNVAIKL